MKRIVLLSHCVLNSMCEDPPAADTYRKCILEAAMEHGVSMIQLPCPELCYQALRRESIYPGTEKAGPYEKYCEDLLQPLIGNLREYRENDVELAAVIGIDTSPSCSVADPEHHDEGPGRSSEGDGLFGFPLHRYAGGSGRRGLHRCHGRTVCLTRPDPDRQSGKIVPRNFDDPAGSGSTVRTDPARAGTV